MRQVLPAGWEQTWPAGGQPRIIPLAEGEVVTGAWFGSRLASTGGDAEIRGKVWNDLDEDGKLDGNEPVLANRTVFIDVNNDGFLNNGDIEAISSVGAGTTMRVTLPLAGEQ